MHKADSAAKLRAHDLLPLLHTCHDSRAQVHKHFTLYQQDLPERYIWANLSQDVLSSTNEEGSRYFRGFHLLQHKEDTLAPVEQITLDAASYSVVLGASVPPQALTSRIVALLRRMCHYTTLREVLFVHDIWKQDFADRFPPSSFKDRYHNKEGSFKMFLDSYYSLGGSMILPTLPSIRHVTRAEFDA